jgi:hypothetical protein
VEHTRWRGRPEGIPLEFAAQVAGARALVARAIRTPASAIDRVSGMVVRRMASGGIEIFVDDTIGWAAAPPS